MRTIDLKKELHRTKINKSCSKELQSYVISTISHFLKKHYSENYSDRCLQASIGIHRMLTYFGISSVLIEGALCVPKVTNGHSLHWQGFWDHHHHYWLYTEHFETIDLTISQIGIHHAFTGTSASPPPIWWTDKRGMPDILTYLPLEQISLQDRTALPEDSENELINDFLNDIESVLSVEKKNYEVVFKHILNDTYDLAEGFKRDDPWFIQCATHNSYNPPLPKWISERIYPSKT